MIDPISGFIIEDKPLKQDLEASETNKRVWRETNKQEWLKVYQNYMQERVLRQPQPLHCRANTNKDNKAQRDSSRYTGTSEENWNNGSLENDEINNLESNSPECIKTVKDLRRCSERQKIKRGLVGISDCDNGIDVERHLPKRTRQKPDPRKFKRKRNDTAKIEYLQIKEKGVGRTYDDEKAENSLEEDLSECEVDDSKKVDEAVYLIVAESDHEETDPKRKVKRKADIEESEEESSNDDFIIHEKKRLNTKETEFQSLRSNSLKLLKCSNICLFKWMKCYLACYICLKIFKDMQTLRNHAEFCYSHNLIKKKMIKDKHSFHKADITDLECNICSAALNSLSELESHLTEHGVKLKSGGSLLMPYKLCGETFTCQLCERTFDTIYRLKTHMDGHFYVCSVCNMGFPNLQSLKVHTEIHNKRGSDDTRKNGRSNKKVSKEPRFKCNYCPQRFKTDYKKLHHLIEEHDTESQLFECEFCPKIFMTVHWLTKHMNSVHREVLYT